MLQFRRPKQNTALNAKTEQFITPKISGNALKQGHRTYSVLPWASEGFFKGGGPLGYFCKFFPEGSKVVKFVFYHSKLKRQPVLLKIFKSSGACPPWPLSDVHECYVRPVHNCKKYKVGHSKSVVKHTTLRWAVQKLKRWLRECLVE